MTCSVDTSCFKQIQPLYKIAVLMGVTPPYNFNTNSVHSVLQHRYYSALILVILFFGSSVSLAGRIHDVYPAMEATASFIDGLAHIALCSINLYSMASLSFRSTEDIKELYKHYIKLDVRLKRTQVLNRKNITIILISCHICLLVFAGFDSYFWLSSVDESIFTNYTFKYFQLYQFGILVIFMNHLICMMKNRFRQLNSMLENAMPSGHNELEISVIGAKDSQPNVSRMTGRIRDLAKSCTILSDMVDIFNKIFGWHVVLLNINILIGVLQPLSLIIVFTNTGESVGGITDGIYLIPLCMVWGGMILFLGISMAACCEATVKEAQKTSTIAFKALQELPELLCNEILREELVVLAQQASLKCPKFSAGGFFNVDYTMLYNLLGSVTSYVVVILQFNK